MSEERPMAMGYSEEYPPMDPMDVLREMRNDVGDWAVTEIEMLRGILGTLSVGVAHGQNHWWLVLDETQPLSDEQAEYLQALLDGESPTNDSDRQEP